MHWFIRFRTSRLLAGTRTPLGVFHAAAEMTDSPNCDPRAAKRAKRVCQWFNRHLPVPKLCKHPHAVFWFRSEHRDMVQRLWELVLLLRNHGFLVELVRTRKPGRVCYEDEYQVAAIPWRSTR
jgi:hypothetical protein